jgi:hypothetical protein
MEDFPFLSKSKSHPYPPPSAASVAPIFPSGIAIKGHHEGSGFSIFPCGGAIGELQMIDAGFVGEEFRLIAAYVLAQRTRGFTTTS